MNNLIRRNITLGAGKGNISTTLRRLLSDEANGKLPQHIVTPGDRFWLRITRTLPENEIHKEVPAFVMEKALNRRRLGMNFGMCIFSAFVFYGIAKVSGKARDERFRKAAEASESL